MADPPLELSRPPAPTRLGPYLLGPIIGRGSSALLYRAYHPLLQRWAALKLLSPRTPAEGTEATSQEAEALLAEGRILASLRHPGVVQIYDAGWHRDRPYLAMELVHGPSLSSLIGNPQPLETVLSLGRQLASTLGYLHRVGIVHADLKPSNVLLSASGHPVVVDFGIAFQQTSGSQTPAGTPAYMAPEQGLGRPGPASDLYALGLVLFQLLTGELPLPQGSPGELLRAHRRLVAREIELLRPGVPHRLAMAVHRCLAKEPSDRFPRAEELERELATAELELSAGRPSRVALPVPRRRTRRLLVLLALLVLSALPFWEAWRLLLWGQP